MHEGCSILAVIPARGGSKGLPGKNIRLLGGKPMLAWTVEAARASTLVDRVVVSTDSPDIAAVARHAGADVPFMRPDHLATDTASSMDCVKHACAELEASGDSFHLVALLSPTSPLRTHEDIDRALRLYLGSPNRKAETLVSVTSIPVRFRWLMELSDGYLRYCLPYVGAVSGRHEFEPLFLPNGAIYLDHVDSLGDSFYAKKTLPFIMPPERSVDIDTLEDFRRAEDALASGSTL